MNGWTYLMQLHGLCSFQSRERQGRASGSEVKRWIKNGAVVVNGEKLLWDEEMDFPVNSVVLFPNNPVTLL